MPIDLVTREEFKAVEEEVKHLKQRYEDFIQTDKTKTYTNAEAAQLFGVSRRTLQNWRDDGLIGFA